MQRLYESEFKKIADKAHKSYMELLQDNDPQTAYQAVSDGIYENFIKDFQIQNNNSTWIWIERL